MVHIRKFRSLDPPSEPADPPAERVVAGEPRAITRTFYESGDGRFSVGEWSCTPGRWRVLYDETEYCRITSGHGTLTDASGDRVPIVAGEEFVVPAGFEGEWEVLLDMVKTWVVGLP